MLLGDEHIHSIQVVSYLFKNCFCISYGSYFCGLAGSTHLQTTPTCGLHPHEESLTMG